MHIHSGQAPQPRTKHSILPEYGTCIAVYMGVSEWVQLFVRDL